LFYSGAITARKEQEMRITITSSEKTIPVSIIHLDGKLDGSNFECLIKEAQKLYTAGTRNLILDMGKLTFMSSAGLGAVHQVALLFHGKKPVEKQDERWSDYRWAAFHPDGSVHNHTPHEFVKLLSPTKEVMELLEMIGFSSLFEIHTDLDQAIASFHKRAPILEASLR
jgi:anti-anti-sigma factor